MEFKERWWDEGTLGSGSSARLGRRAFGDVTEGRGAEEYGNWRCVERITGEGVRYPAIYEQFRDISHLLDPLDHHRQRTQY
jgi:hypothetical protein